jgi:hypothetical protein
MILSGDVDQKIIRMARSHRNPSRPRSGLERFESAFIRFLGQKTAAVMAAGLILIHLLPDLVSVRLLLFLFLSGW